MQDLVSVNSQTKFGVIRLIESRIGEVIINEGVVVDMELALNFCETLMQLFSHDFALLLNEKYTHSYTAEARKYLSELKHLKAMAVLFQMRFHDAANQYLRVVDEHARWNMKVFYDRGRAIEWLEEQLSRP